MSRILIVGCGFLGKAAADLFLRQGYGVTAVVQAESSAAQLRQTWAETPQAELVAADVAEAEAVRNVIKNNEASWAAWLHCASSRGGDAEAYHRVYERGVRNLVEALPEARGLFVSSTSVYGQTDGSWVDETSPTEPPRPTGRILLAAERIALAAGGVVLRLAGLYGPGRSVLLRKFLAGEARIEAGAARWVNQIHREDAAGAVVCLLEAPAARVRGEVFNGADDTPWLQGALLREMARRLGRPAPPEGAPDYGRKRGWTNKRVANGKLRALGWEPQFPDYFADWARLRAAEEARWNAGEPAENSPLAAPGSVRQG